MPITKRGWFFVAAIVLLFVLVTSLVLLMPWTNPIDTLVRLFALYGYIELSLATMVTPFLKEVTLLLGRPFIKIHHFFSLSGTVLVTLHPVTYAIQKLNITFFLPHFDSLQIFFFWGGDYAIILLFLVLISGSLRRKMKYWKSFHVLSIVALLLGIVHGSLRNVDFQNIEISFIFDLLFLGALLAFALKRYNIHKVKRKAKSRPAVVRLK